MSMKIKVYPWPEDPSKLAVYTGNTCNLACILCSPEASSKWRGELGLGKYTGLDTEIDDYDFSKFKHVTFTGGEPLLNESTLEVLKKLKNNVSIQFHANGTVLPSDDYLVEFSRFLNFTLVFSIDDIEEQFEYLRWPAKWDEVSNNVIWFKDNCPDNVKFGINVVVSVLNIKTHHRVKEWADKIIPANRAGIMTVVDTNKAKFRLSGELGENMKDDMVFLFKVDTRRKTNYKNVFPENNLNFKPR